MAATESGRVWTGPRARLKMLGKNRGWARNLNMRERVQYDPVRVLDNVRVQEQVPLMYEVSLDAEQVFIVGRSLKQDGIFPGVGGDPDTHLRNILDIGEIDVSVEDNRTSQIMASFPDAKCSEHGLRVDAGSIVGEDVQFVATVMLDVTEVGSVA